MLRKTATIVLSPLEAPSSITKRAHRHVFAYTPRHGMLYVRSRMISSRCNDNFDEFPSEEIAKGFRSFIGKPVFVNHVNDDHRAMRGIIIDAALHRDTNPDGSPDTWVEGLMEVDALTYPKLGKAIVLRHIERTSMGVDVDFSKCSACGNVATTPLEYCFPAGVPITMADGTLKSIENVAVGDMVLTHDGARRVTKLFRNHYNGDLAVIRRQGYGHDLKVTHGHPILANLVGRRDSSKSGATRYESIHDGRNWDWVPSEDLAADHWVQGAYPTEVATKVIDVTSLSSQFEALEGRATLTSAHRFGAQAGRVEYGKNSLPERVSTDDLNLAFIAGLYLAEGNVAEKSHAGLYKEVQWALGGGREALIPDLQRALDALDAGQGRIYEAIGDSVSFRVSNAPLAALLQRWCGSGSGTKALSGEIMTAPAEFQRAFLDAYRRGDGWNDPRGHNEIRTSSGLLARQLIMLGGRVHASVPTWFVNTKNSGGPANRSRAGTLHHVAIGRSGSMKGRRRLDDGYVAQKITQVGTEHFHGTVYNFEVEDNHSYVAEGMVVHNCRHVPGMKGRKYYRVTASGKREGKLIYETCFGLRFFENSLLVEDPADPTAYFLGDIEFGPGLDHLAQLHVQASVPALTRTATKQARFTAEWPPGRPRVDVVDPRMLVDPEPIRPTSSLRLVQATRCEACRCRDTVSDSVGYAECLGCGHAWHEAAKAKMLSVEAAKYDKPEDHPFFQAHPVHHQNIVDHWNRATDNEKASGERWYPDAHLVAQALGEHAAKRGITHPEGNTHLAAGILANHSPQNGWAGNMHDTARVLHEGKGIGGPGAGMFASTHQKNNDEKMLSGQPYHKVLAGPKINDFAHLIEHGGDKEPENPHVVIDRHALGVAAGHSLTDEEYSSAPMSGAKRKDGTTNRRYYDHVVDQYHKAAKVISAKEGRNIPGHAVQAVTWLVRQRLNQKAERAQADSGVDSRLNRGREKSRTNAEEKWHHFRTQHGIDVAGPGTGYQASLGDNNVAKPPELKAAMEGVSLGKDGDGYFVYTHRARSDSYSSPHEIPKSKIDFIESTGVRHVGYGETKAPAKVDTLRDENCPVCFPPETLVRTKAGYVPIATVQVDDEVLSKNGVFRRVTQVHENDYDGVLHEIHARSLVEPIRATPEHPFSVLVGKHMYPTKVADRCRPGRCAQYGTSAVVGRWGSTTITHGFDWAEAKELVKGQFLATNVPQDDQLIDMASVSVPVWARGKHARKGPVEFALTEEFLWMVGLYLAEGSAGKRSLSFALHQKEVEYIDRLEKLFETLGYSTAIYTRPGHQGAWVEVHSSTLADWFPAWLGSGSHNKALPAELLALPDSKLQAAIQGVLDGDAHKARSSLRQTSSVLALQVAEFFVRTGHGVSLFHEEPEDKKIACVLNYDSSDQVTARTWRVGGTLVSEITEVRVMPYAGKVYNLTVEGDPSYTVQNVLVHNCGEQDAWDGNTCAVCQYVAPPEQFQDPDLDRAKQLDLRQEQQDYDDSIQPKQVDDLGDAGGDEQPMLVCSHCGAEFESGEPGTTNTEDPQAGDVGIGPAEGDVCPNCGKGELLDGTDAAQLGAVPDGGEDENEAEDQPPGVNADQPADSEDPGVVDPRDLVGDEDPQDGSEVQDGDDPDDDEDSKNDKGKPAKGKPFTPKK